MRNLKITKIVVSMMLMLGLTTSSFAMGVGDKKMDKNIHDGKAKVEHKVEKKDVKVINVAKKDLHKKDIHKKDLKIAKHHDKKHHHKKDVVVVEKQYVTNTSNDNIATACVTAIGLGLIAAAIANS